MGAAEGPFAALIAYEAELLKVRETLKQWSKDYGLREGEVAELWGGRE